MDSDDTITTINDTTEAYQVARCIRQAYFDMIEDLNPPEQYSLFEVTDSGTSTKPTLMTVPTDVNKIVWIKYNKIRDGETVNRFETIDFMPMDQFLNRMYQLDTDESNVGSYTVDFNGDNIQVNYVNDRAPTYYTSLANDNYILFDSYDSTIDGYLDNGKTIAYGRKIITFNLEDSFIPVLDENYFSRLLNEAKVLAFAELKSTDHAIANRNAKRSRNRSVAQKYKLQTDSDFNQLPYFGRK